MKLILIRHGLTEGNVRQLYYGSTDLPLLPEGVEALQKQAAAGIYPTGAKRYYTSPLIRTQQTLKNIYGDVPFTVVDDLREMPFGIFEMATYDEIKDHPLYQGWKGDTFSTYVGPGGESWEMVALRGDKALREIIARGEDAVCVTHGGLIGSVMTMWFPGRIRPFVDTPEPGKGFILTVEDGEVKDFTPIV